MHLEHSMACLFNHVYFSTSASQTLSDHFTVQNWCQVSVATQTNSCSDETWNTHTTTVTHSQKHRRPFQRIKKPSTHSKLTMHHIH